MAIQIYILLTYGYGGYTLIQKSLIYEIDVKCIVKIVSNILPSLYNLLSLFFLISVTAQKVFYGYEWNSLWNRELIHEWIEIKCVFHAQQQQNQVSKHRAHLYTMLIIAICVRSENALGFILYFIIISSCVWRKIHRVWWWWWQW